MTRALATATPSPVKTPRGTAKAEGESRVPAVLSGARVTRPYERCSVRDGRRGDTARPGRPRRVRDGETVVLVCFEGDRKRCHRSLLQERLRERVDAP
ncbi:DUF488 family protein, N3 subclade [Haloarcula sediminis]|uniref:DUF488 family protein, N3 subclade n=1 Tax=Haloarcula sediminis TaxID=3111777 RepID=UPI00387E5D58